MRCLLVAVAVLAVVATGCGGDEPERTAPFLELPADVGPACGEIARTSELPVLCPRAGRGEGTVRVVHADLDPSPCAYVVNLETPLPRRDGRRPFHVMFGGACDRLPLRSQDGIWPPEPPDSLRLAGSPPLQSGDPPRVSKPRVLRRESVRGHPGLLLQAAPFPAGGFPGGHYSLVWNEGGHGYMVSLHVAAGDREGPPDAAALRALHALADGMTPA